MSDQQQPPPGYGQGHGQSPGGYPPQGHGPQPGYPPQYGYAPQGAPPPKPSWYHSSIIIGVSLFFCAPLGLILLWTSKTTSGATKVLGTVIFGGLFMFVLLGNAASKHAAPTYVPPATTVAALAAPRETATAPAAAATATPVSESCLALSTKFGTESKLSDLQKDELWKGYDGRSFAWDLKITEVSAGLLSGFTVQAKCSPRSSSLIQDIQISYGPEAKSFVMSLEKDSVYKLKGVLNHQSSLLGLTADGIP